MEPLVLVSSEGSWERPAIHRILGLLYRTLPLVRLELALCELIFGNFHQLAKQDIAKAKAGTPLSTPCRDGETPSTSRDCCQCQTNMEFLHRGFFGGVPSP